MTDLAIEIKDLQKMYGSFFKPRGTEAVQGITLSIPKGSVWALAGPNGAGKTTTLYCLMGLLCPTGGTVRVFGEDPRTPKVRTRIGFQSEVFFSYAFRKPKEVLRFYGKLSGMADDELDPKIEKLLVTVGLEHAKEKKVGTFSKGMVQRLGLAQSLLHDPDLIIWDEPTTGLDPEGRKVVLDLIAELKSSGKTILLSTHILTDIERVCDHIAIVNRGKIVVSEDIETLKAQDPNESLEDLYLRTTRGDSNAK